MLQLIRRFLARYPRLQRRARQSKLCVRYALSPDRSFTFETHPKTSLLTPWIWASAPEEPGDLFFGYYDKSPWSSDGRAMLMHCRRRPSDPEVEICLFDRQSGLRRTVARTTAWNLQQGAMAQWLRGEGEGSLVFNDVHNRRLVARIVNGDGTPRAIVPMPVQTVHPNGREALALNYQRLWRLRPEYGYRPAVENFTANMPLDRDGIWHLDLTSGRSELLISLAQLLAVEPRPEMNPARTKVNHAIFSPSGQCFVFMHRWFARTEKHSRLLVMNSDGSGLRLLLDTQLVTHYHWQDDRRVIVFGRAPNGEVNYFLLDVSDGSFSTFDRSGLGRYGDGHPTFSPDGRWIVTDSYPDVRFQQHLLLYDIGQRTVVEVARLRHPPRYFGPTRCDLHPRWSPDGRRISFDSVWNGARRSYILDVSSLVSGG